MATPLHFSIPGEFTDTPVRVDFNSKSFELHINDVSRSFTSAHQVYNYLRALYGHERAMEILALIANHHRKMIR
jgi:hypothetical protein